ncbi:PLP-dependent aminotransferase family protein [Dehalobacter sp. DCM]|uniref:MocR-like pyridoxine biosynthesis transcription factor PdxR n=1 Tax=Dehalobacter sp. DCM TaxID=2907827 RepID=UPI00308146C8|nr:PLP-dependent aminotransferase family protein [Dehalobacter sp. DCM]
MLILNNNGRSLYEQLYEALRQSILQGDLKENDALKPIRVLAEELQISNNTVSKAYLQLLDEGYIRSVQGSGYYVENVETLEISRALAGTVPEKIVKSGNSSEGAASEQSAQLKYDFNYASFESSFFPWTKWRKYTLDAMLEESYAMDIAYECNKGNVKLRESLCNYVNTSRGVKCTLDQLVISAGTQFAMDIILELLPEEIHTIGVEDPSFIGMQKIFTNKRFSIKMLPLTDSGIDMDALENSKCQLLYLTPSHQFPTGVTTSLTKRLQILEWAKKNQAYIIENDYDNEFLYGEKPLPSIGSLSSGQNVIYLSTLSKVLSPSIRCAYFVLPYNLMAVYQEKYKYYNSSLPTYHQTALAYFIRDGHLERHVRKLSQLHRRKYEIFKKVMQEQLADSVKIYPTPAGSHVLIQIMGCMNQEDLINKMRLRGFGIYGTKVYWQNQQKAPENIFLFGFNSLPEEEMEAAIKGLACALKEIL